MTHAKPISSEAAGRTLSAGLALRALVLMSLILAMMSIGLAGSASAKSRESLSRQRTLMLRTKFSRFGSGELIGDDRYVLVYGNSTGVLIDARTGHRATVSEPGCLNAAAIGGSSIVFTCGQGTITPISYELYRITTGQSQALSVNPSIIESGPVTAVGTNWIAFASYCAMEHCEKTFAFQNLATGATAADPSGLRTALDLNSPSLGRAVCSPVTVPRTNIGSEAYLAGWGSVTFDGRFVATSDGGSYLERCGSRLHEFLTYTSYPGCAHAACAPPFNSHVIVWESAPLRLSGIFLPSRQRFTIPVPAKVDPAPGGSVNGDQYLLALTSHTLYVENSGSVWTTPIPSAPPRATRSRAERRGRSSRADEGHRGSANPSPAT